MRLGLVTYNWGKDWDLPTLIKNCEAAGFEGVELRTTHKHGVEISLNKQQRADVAKRFDDSPVELVVLGSTCEYHSPDAAVVKKRIEETKDFIELCHDVGASGVTVRPHGIPAGVPVEKTLAQIGKSLKEVAQHGEGFGVEIYLEIHGRGTAEIPRAKTIMDHADHPGAKVCWNCNPTDENGKGLEANFKLVEDRLGTVHIHDLISKYPWRRLFHLLRQKKFEGWTLLEEGSPTADPARVMKYYRLLWETLAHGERGR
ncbi:MAG: sugar phosphate isomerase/epimerase [Planctomycetales bacterium]